MIAKLSGACGLGHQGCRAVLCLENILSSFLFLAEKDEHVSVILLLS